MQQLFGWLSAILSIIMVIPYIHDILKQRAKPERASWLIWTVLGSIAFFSQWAKGATDSLWLTAGQTLGTVIVFLLSLKYGVGGLTKRDTRALIAACVGLALWYLTSEPLLALIFVIIIDCIGVYLTLLKIYHDPNSETRTMWLISGTSGIFGALAVGSFNPILLAYPLYIVIVNYTTVAAITLAKKKR